MRLRNIGAGLLRARATAAAALPAGYVLWLDTLASGAMWADVARTTPATVGGSVASWYDSSTGYAATQGTAAARPTRQAGGVQFRSQRLVGAPPFTATGDCTILLVSSFDSAPAAQAVAFSMFINLRPLISFDYRSPDVVNGRWTYFEDDINNIGNSNRQYLSSFVVSNMYVWSLRSGPGPSAVNSVTIARTGLPNRAGDRTGQPRFTNQQMILGAQQPGGSLPASCTMRAVVAYSRALTDTEFTGAIAFLAARHGIV